MNLLEAIIKDLQTLPEAKLVEVALYVHGPTETEQHRSQALPTQTPVSISFEAGTALEAIVNDLQTLPEAKLIEVALYVHGLTEAEQRQSQAFPNQTRVSINLEAETAQEQGQRTNNPNLHRLISNYFSILGIPLSLIGICCIVILCSIAVIGSINIPNLSGRENAPVNYSFIILAIINILWGLSLMFGYFQLARPFLTWKEQTINRFWWGSFLYNCLQTVLILLLFGLPMSSLSGWVAILIPFVGAVLSFICLYETPTSQPTR